MKDTKNKVKLQAKNTNWLYAALLVVFGALIYAKSVGYNFTYWDDDFYLLQKFSGKEINFSTLLNSLTEYFGLYYYRPILKLSFAFDTMLSGTNPLNPAVFRIMNLLFHIISSVLLYFLLNKLNFGKKLSFLFSLFFTAHPIMTVAVAWIPGRNDSLVTIFIFTSAIFFLNYFKYKDNKSLYLHFIFFLLALLTKESSLVFPLLCYVYLYFNKKDDFKIKPEPSAGKGIQLKNPKRTINTTKEVIIYRLVPAWVIALVIYLFLRMYFAPFGANASDQVGISAIITNSLSIFAIFGKIFLPVKMNGCAQFETLSVISGVIAVTAILIIALTNKNVNRKSVLFGALWFLVFIIPTLFAKLSADYFDYLEHRAYLPFLGVIIILYELIKSFKIKESNKIFTAVFLVIVLFLGLRTFFYEEQYQDRKSFWTAVSEMYPDIHIGWGALALAYQLENNAPKAEELYLKAVQIKPNDINYINSLAYYAIIKNDMPNILKFAEAGVKADEKNSRAYSFLGQYYAMTKNLPKAKENYETALSLDNKQHDWYYNLGVVCFNMNDFANAEKYFAAAVNLSPQNPDYWFKYAISLVRQNQINEAEEILNQTIKIDGKYVDAYKLLINIYSQTNQQDKLVKAQNQLRQIEGK